MNPPEIRLDPATGRIAVRTELPDPRTWFIYDTHVGGHYAPGTRSPDDVTDWPPYTPPIEAEE